MPAACLRQVAEGGHSCGRLLGMVGYEVPEAISGNPRASAAREQVDSPATDSVAARATAWEGYTSGIPTVSVGPTSEQRSERLGCLCLHARQYVLIDAHREGNVGVSEALAHDLDGHARLEEQGRVSVPQVVK